MGCGVVYSEVVAEVLDEVAGLVGGGGVDVHSEELSGSDVGYLVVASFENEVVVYRLSLGVPG